MAQWAKVQQSPHIFRQMQQFYMTPFSMEVRYFLCQWIEEQQWDSIDENNPQYSSIAEAILKEMIDLLGQKTAELTAQEFFIIRVKLQESVQKMESVVKNNPLELVKIIKQCLQMEKNLIENALQAEQQQHFNDDMTGGGMNGVNDKIIAAIDQLQRRTVSTDLDLKSLKEKQESFIIKFSDSQRITAQMQHNSQPPETPDKVQKSNILKKQKDELDYQLTQLAKELLNHRIDLARKYGTTIDSLSELQKEILDNELIAWKRRQQLSGNGLVMKPSSLETLQQWCESLADLIWQNRQQIKQVTQLQQQLPIKAPDGEEDLLPKLNDTITGLLSSIVTSTFIVEHQPPQVLKKDARFGAVVRLLVGGKLNVHMNPPQVKATIISESQAKDLLRNDNRAKNDTSGDILNNTGTMEYEHNTGKLSISFKNMQLKKIKRADKKGAEAVTEEKFCVLFQSDFSVGGNELVFQVWTLSLPVVVTVHGNQECNATATVLWDNAFAEPGRVPFVVPDTVKWPLLADQLSMKFMSMTHKGLSETNLQYIATKLFGEKDHTQCMVTWAQFNKDPIPGRAFTFWEWFHAIQKLTKEHLKDLWIDDAIMGFVKKENAQNWLSSKPQGTFLLRFSDSEIGGVTIAWIGERNEVWNLAPFTTKDFAIRGLADRVKDLNTLVFLYPDILKDSIFSKYYTHNTEQVSSDGYIRPELKTCIPPKYNPLEEHLDAYPLSPTESYPYNSQPGSVATNPGNDMEELPGILGGMNIDTVAGLTDYMPEDIDELAEMDLSGFLGPQQDFNNSM